LVEFKRKSIFFKGLTNLQGPQGLPGPIGDRGYKGDRGQSGYLVCRFILYFSNKKYVFV
jgi:hypothetical protein